MEKVYPCTMHKSVWHSSHLFSRKLGFDNSQYVVTFGAGVRKLPVKQTFQSEPWPYFLTLVCFLSLETLHAANQSTYNAGKETTAKNTPTPPLVPDGIVHLSGDCLVALAASCLGWLCAEPRLVQHWFLLLQFWLSWWLDDSLRCPIIFCTWIWGLVIWAVWLYHFWSLHLCLLRPLQPWLANWFLIMHNNQRNRFAWVRFVLCRKCKKNWETVLSPKNYCF